jgi:hypothetical protein
MINIVIDIVDRYTELFDFVDYNKVKSMVILGHARDSQH